MNVNSSTPSLTGTTHIDTVDLTHIPDPFKPNNRQLLREYADIFSKNDLDSGHSKHYPTKLN